MFLISKALFSVLLLFGCSLQDTSAATARRTGDEFYGNVVETICRTSKDFNKCITCFKSLINRKFLSTKEITDVKVKQLKSCMVHVADDFQEFRCDLEKNSSYYLTDFVGTNCSKKLQSSSPFIDLENADLGKRKSNFGYFGLGEFTDITLAGILKHFKDFKALPHKTQKGKSSKKDIPKEDDCTLFQNSKFLTALSQANGKSWETNFEKRSPMFFETISKHVCNSTHVEQCKQCLNKVLNAETIAAKDLPSEVFAKYQECKQFLSAEYKKFNRELKTNNPTFETKIPKSCISSLKLKEKSFKYDKDVLPIDLTANTFLLQRVLKFGISAVFYYFNQHNGTISDDMTSGLCETVVHRYVKAFLFAKPMLHQEGEHMVDLMNPYKELLEKTCNDGDKCESCFWKILTLVDIKRPREVSEANMKVFDYCMHHLPDDFKTFARDLEDVSFKDCILNGTVYDKLVAGYPIDETVDIKRAHHLPHYTQFKKVLMFLFDGTCYYYREKSEEDTKVAEKLHQVEVPGAFLYAIPSMNSYNLGSCKSSPEEEEDEDDK